MTCRGHVKNGVIVLDEPAELPDGTKVEVRPVVDSSVEREASDEAPTLYERLEPVIGKAKNMPPDAATNYEHYLYGLPKQK